LKNLLEHDIAPYKVAMRGSTGVNIKVDKFKELIDSIQNKTKNEISKELEISRQTLSNYQSGQSLPSEETFEKLISLFTDLMNNFSKSDIIEPVNPIGYSNIKKSNTSEKKIEEEINLKGFRGEVNEKLLELEFQNQWFKQLPWDGLSISSKSDLEKLIFFTGVGEKEHLENLLNRMYSTQNVIKLFGNKSIWIIQNEKLIPDLQKSVIDKTTDFSILSYHDLPKLKRDRQ
jgi:predicted transcriptional regulator